MNLIPINVPLLGEEEKEAVRAVLDSGILTNASYEGGKCVREFEAAGLSLAAEYPMKSTSLSQLRHRVTVFTRIGAV